MAIDASIYQNYLRPVKSIQDFDNEAMAAQGNALQLQQQRMQMNALQQQQQDDQALRNYLAGGAKLDTPEGQAGLYRVAPKAAGGILKSQAEIAKENAAAGKDKALSAKASQEMIGESIKNSRMNLEGVTTPEQYIAWHEANHKDPVLGPYLESRGVTVDQARARINQALQTPGGFAQLLNESKLGAEKAYANAMQEKTLAETGRHNKASEGIQVRGQDVTAATAKAERDQRERLASQGVTYQQDASGNLVALPTKLPAGAGSVAPSPVMVNGQPLQGKGGAKQSFSQHYDQLNGVIGEIRGLLPKSTASGLGSAVDSTVGFFGASTPGADAAAKLETLGGWLTSTVPRFEGPQSDRDTAQYRMMAGDVGNSKLPVSQRLQKLEALKQFMDSKAKGYGLPVVGNEAQPSGVPPEISAILKKHGGK